MDNTLAFQLWMEAPDDLHTIELLIDQLELELYGGNDGVEAAPGLSSRITPLMRAALHREAAEAGMDLDAYLHDLCSALYRTHGKGGEDEFAEDEDDADTEEIEDPSFNLKDDKEDDLDTTLRLPGQGGVREQDYGTDSTGLPQGVISQQGGSPAPSRRQCPPRDQELSPLCLGATQGEHTRPISYCTQGWGNARISAPGRDQIEPARRLL